LAWDGLVRPRWLVGTFLRTLLTDGMPHFENLYAYRGVPIVARSVQREFGGRAQFTWESLKEIRRAWHGRLIVKGVLHPGDARLAIAAGADGLIVSNHGGRQLDAAPAPLHMLPAMCEAAGSVPVMIDSGIRRGTDIIKSFALGAKFCFVGRPFNYAAIFGQEGVQHAIGLLRAEVSRDTGNMGANAMSEITRECIVERDPQRRPS